MSEQQAAGEGEKRISVTKVAEPDIYTGFEWGYDFFSWIGQYASQWQNTDS